MDALTIPSMVDRPFGCPPDIVLDLPAPLSVNRIWRRTKTSKVSKSEDYKRWIAEADGALLEFKQTRGVKPIAGKFAATIIVKRSRVDLDNNAKCVLDFLQSRNFIMNDAYCEELTLKWGEVPLGCRVIVRPCA